MARVRRQRFRAIDLEPGWELEGHGTITVMSGLNDSVRLETEGGFKETVRAAQLFYVILPEPAAEIEEDPESGK